MGTMMSPQDTYARHLQQPYGYPLRTPEPSPTLPESYQCDGLQIGDVGYVDTHGRFQVLFNIRLSSEHELHRKRGVPDQFEPVELDIDEVSDVNSNELPKDCVVSSGVEQPPRNKDDSNLNYEFLSSSASGAILMLPVGTVRCDLRDTEEFRRIAIEHAHHWCTFARRDSLYLITGLHKTSSWALASFDRAPRGRQIIVERDSSGTHNWDCRFNVDRRHSPAGNDTRNQTVFILGFRIAVKWWAPEPLIEWVPRSRGIWSTLSIYICWFANICLTILGTLFQCFRLRSVDHVPRLSQPYHPSDAINRYLLDKDCNAQVAITHDSQWISMLEKEELTHKELTQEGHLRSFLSERYTWNSDDNAVYLGPKIEDTDATCNPSDSHEGFSLRVPPNKHAQIVITRMRAENVVLVLRRMPIGFYITVQFNGMTIRTENKSVLVCDSIIEWEEEISLPLDPSILVRFTLCATYEFDPMLGNGQALLTKEIKVNDLVGSTYLVTSPSAESSPSCSSLLVTFERPSFNRFGSPSSHDSRRNHSTPHWEKSTALSYETDLGHQALVRYHVHYGREDLKKAVEHFEAALVLCPHEHPCHAATLSNLAMAKFIVCQVDGIYTALDAPTSFYRQALELRPDGHPDRPATLLHLAQVLCCRYGKLGREEAVADEIRELANEVKGICSEGTHEHRAAELVLQTCTRYTAGNGMGHEVLDVLISELDHASRVPPDGYFDVPQRLMNLSVALRRRSWWSDARGSIDKAIALNKEVLHLTADGDPFRVRYLSYLGNSLYIRFGHYNELGDLQEGINLLRTALEIYPLGHHDRAESLDVLAHCLDDRFRESDMLTDLEEAIGLLQAEWNLPRTHAPTPDWLLEELVRLLHIRFRRLDTVVDLNEAIALQRTSLEFSRPTDSYPSYSAGHLASLLSTRFDLRGEVSDLDGAVRVCRDNLERCPQGHRLRWFALGSLADALRRRFERLGAMDDLNEAITMQATLELDLPQQYSSPSFWGVHTRCLVLRFSQLKTITDLDAAIASSHAELLLFSPDDSLRYYPLLNLAACLRTRFENLRIISDLDESVALHREAMKLEPRHIVPLCASGLVHCLMIRFRQLNMTSDLDEPIALHRVSLDNLEPDDPYRPMSLDNLATCLRIRFEDQGMIADLDEAITLYSSALELYQPDHPDRTLCLGGLARSLTSRFHQSKQCNDMDEALHSYSMLSRVSLGVAADLGGAIAWVDAAEEFGHETRVLAYQTCLRFLLHRLIPSSPSAHHPPILENLASSLAMDAFSACLRDRRFSNAVELLEQGRDIFWSALLRLRSPLDEVIASEENGKMLAQSFMQLASLIRNLPALLYDLTDQYNRPWKLNSRLQNIVSDIRMLPGLSRFLEPPLFSDLQKAASHGALVIVNASKYSCDALIILHHRDPVHVPLKTTKAHVAELASRLRSLTTISEVDDRAGAVILVLQELWSLVVSPIAEILQKFQPLQSRIWWYPTAEFSLLPLHASGPYDEGQPNFTDLYISSYTTSLMELIRARWKSLSYSSADQPRFVAVDTVPDVTEDGRDLAKSDLAPLMRRLVPLAMLTCIKGHDSKVARVAEELGRNEFVHIDCPAFANPQRPFESSLILSDGHLKMEDIMRLDTQQAQFAFLSASHTDGGDESEQSSREMVHITAAMQCAGFPSVVGPMWAVDPVLARVMAARLYENMMVGDTSRRLDHTRAARALHRTITSCTEIPFDQRIMWLHMGI